MQQTARFAAFHATKGMAAVAVPHLGLDLTLAPNVNMHNQMPAYVLHTCTSCLRHMITSSRFSVAQASIMQGYINIVMSHLLTDLAVTDTAACSCHQGRLCLCCCRLALDSMGPAATVDIMVRSCFHDYTTEAPPYTLRMA